MTLAKVRKVLDLLAEIYVKNADFNFLVWRGRDAHETFQGRVSRLGGVVVSVLATVPKSCGFEPGQGDECLRAIKIRSTPSFGWEVKREGPKIS
jgi:hypothetical protein